MGRMADLDSTREVSRHHARISCAVGSGGISRGAKNRPKLPRSPGNRVVGIATKKFAGPKD